MKNMWIVFALAILPGCSFLAIHPELVEDAEIIAENVVEEVVSLEQNKSK